MEILYELIALDPRARNFIEQKYKKAFLKSDKIIKGASNAV